MTLAEKEYPLWPHMGLTRPSARITVQITMLPVDKTVRVDTVRGQSIGKLKEYFSTLLKMEKEQLNFKYNDNMLGNSVVFGNLGVLPKETLNLTLSAVDPLKAPLKPFPLKSEKSIVNVKVTGENGVVRTVKVEVEKLDNRKPFLGGYRHKKDHRVFHNATSQTNRRPRVWHTTMHYTRSTQTTEQRNKLMQTPRETSTQMTKIGCFVSRTTDKLKEPGKYFTAQEREDLVLRKVIVLQKYFRRYLATQFVLSLKVLRDRQREYEKQKYLQRLKDKERKIMSEFERKLCPRSDEDFDTLYDALEKWRLSEIARINASLTGAERKTALYILLGQETEHLSAIARHKIQSDTEKRANKIQKFFNQTSRPKKIKEKMYKHIISVENPEIIRAQGLRDIYNSLILKHLTLDERLDILISLKHVITEHPCKLTQEILQLIDREADLLIRGVTNKNLEGLRKRTSTLYLQFTKIPFFNPEAAKFIRVPQNPLKIMGKVYFCLSCSSYLHSSQFPLNVNARNPGNCKQCFNKDNIARHRIDCSSYRHMFKELRLSEQHYKDDSTIAYLLQNGDIRYLVEKIWNSESIISNCTDLHELLLVRWDSSIPWTPWNCLLITIDEAEKHGKLQDIYKAYDEAFITKVEQKHLLARHYFSRLPGTAEILRRHKKLTRPKGLIILNNKSTSTGGVNLKPDLKRSVTGSYRMDVTC